MRRKVKTEAGFKLITTLWGLLLTKCFLLEFLVRHYEVPINSLTYVWTLSILMATVATSVYVNLSNEIRPHLYQQAAFGLGAALLTLVALLAPSSLGGMALALAGLVLALKHGLAVLQGNGAHSRWLALGWLAATLSLVYFGLPVGFLIFALSLFCLMVIPEFADFLLQRKQPYSQQF